MSDYQMSHDSEKSLAEDPTAVAEALVSRLYYDILQESCVVFVGAGSTIEHKRTGRKPFYDDIKNKAHYPSDAPPPSFPELMQYFCERIDGSHHNRLLREGISRIEFFSAGGENNQSATIFTDLLTEVPYSNRFVTTNWDPFLERSLGVLVPIVEDRDLAFDQTEFLYHGE